MTVKVLCPAKVNLFLAVGPVDSRGYHPIRTIFQAVGLFDELTVSIAETESLECNWPGLPASNTITKSLRFLREFGDVPPLKIRLEKRIPSEAGLGGGSSDAAGILRAANHLTYGRFSPENLMEVASAVGADVPFFLVGGRAKGEGYGEKLEAMEDGPTRWLVIAKPSVGCSTKEAYASLDAQPYPWRAFPEGDELYNDFERVMPCDSDDWSEHLMLLGARRTLLCGSGSAVFGEFESEADARKAEADLAARRGVESWAVPTLTRKESLQVQQYEP